MSKLLSFVVSGSSEAPQKGKNPRNFKNFGFGQYNAINGSQGKTCHGIMESLFRGKCFLTSFLKDATKFAISISSLLTEYHDVVSKTKKKVK